MNKQPIIRRKLRMDVGETGAFLSYLENINDQLNQAAGSAAKVEMLMRVIGQISEPVQVKIKENYEKHGRRKAWSENYRDCALWSLIDAIVEVFENNITLDDSQTIESIKIKDLRNKLLHADYLELMKIMGIDPIGLQIYPRKELEPGDIIDAIKSLEKNRVLTEFTNRANEAVAILKKILWFLAKK